MLIGSVPLDSQLEQIASQWMSPGGGTAVVLPALMPRLTHAQVFAGGTFPTLEKCTASTWSGSGDGNPMDAVFTSPNLNAGVGFSGFTTLLLSKAPAISVRWLTLYPMPNIPKDSELIKMEVAGIGGTDVAL